MTRIKCFVAEESAAQPGMYVIRPIYENFYLNYTKGSYNIICARLLNLSYPQYLRMCRDCFEAEIIGKGSNYPVAYFKRGEKIKALIDLLNTRANSVLWEREHPELEEHLQYIKNKNPQFYERIINK